MPVTETAHDMLADGESTANWFCQKGQFWGHINQLLLCARCGQAEHKRHDETRHYRDILKPSFHMICNNCHESLPS